MYITKFSVKNKKKIAERRTFENEVLFLRYLERYWLIFTVFIVYENLSNKKLFSPIENFP